MNKRCCFPPRAPRGGAGGTTGLSAGPALRSPGAPGAGSAPRQGQNPHPAPPQPTSGMSYPLPWAGRNNLSTGKAMGTPDRAPSLDYGKGTPAPRLPGRCIKHPHPPCCLIHSPSPPSLQLFFTPPLIQTNLKGRD